MNRDFLKSYIFGSKTSKQIVEEVAQKIQLIINDKTPKKTEVIRDGGFVHGRIHPVKK